MEQLFSLCQVKNLQRVSIESFDLEPNQFV